MSWNGINFHMIWDKISGKLYSGIYHNENLPCLIRIYFLILLPGKRIYMYMYTIDSWTIQTCAGQVHSYAVFFQLKAIKNTVFAWWETHTHVWSTNFSYRQVLVYSEAEFLEPIPHNNKRWLYIHIHLHLCVSIQMRYVYIRLFCSNL